MNVLNNESLTTMASLKNSNWTTRDIARFFGLTERAICYRLTQARKRGINVRINERLAEYGRQGNRAKALSIGGRN